jgi:hypothetical protein
MFISNCDGDGNRRNIKREISGDGDFKLNKQMCDMRRHAIIYTQTHERTHTQTQAHAEHMTLHQHAI